MASGRNLPRMSRPTRASRPARRRAPSGPRRRWERASPSATAPTRSPGRALYVDDLSVPGMLHGRTVRSTVRARHHPAHRVRPGLRLERRGHRRPPGHPGREHGGSRHRGPAAAGGERDPPRRGAHPAASPHADPERAEAARRAVRVEVEPLEPVLTIEESLAARIELHGADNVFKQYHIAPRRPGGRLRRGRRAWSRACTAAGTRSSSTSRPTASSPSACRRRDHRARLDAVPLLRAQGARAHVRPAGRRGSASIQAVTGGGFGGKEEYPSVIAGARRAARVEERAPGEDGLRPARGHRRHHQAPPRRHPRPHRRHAATAR